MENAKIQVGDQVMRAMRSVFSAPTGLMVSFLQMSKTANLQEYSYNYRDDAKQVYARFHFAINLRNFPHNEW